jgi:hypothetical protein
MDVIRDDHREPELVGEGHMLRDEPVVVEEQVMGELDVEGPVCLRVALGSRPRSVPVADEQASRDLARAAAREGDQALGVLLEKRLGEPRDALGSVEIRAGDEAAQAPVAGGITREQDEVRRVIDRAGAGDEPLVVIVEAAEELRDDELAVVLDAADRTSRPVVLHVAGEA